MKNRYQKLCLANVKIQDGGTHEARHDGGANHNPRLQVGRNQARP